MSVDILILGAGWTSTFLVPLCQQSNISFACTTRSGSSPNTLKFEFQPTSDDPEPYALLPDATTVLITFPILVSGAAERLVRLYKSTRRNTTVQPAFILFGTTGIWDKSPPGLKEGQCAFYDRNSPFTLTGRSTSEIELLALADPTTVINLAGLWGDKRIPRNWRARVGPTKEALKAKGGLHLIHGHDIARAVLSIHADFEKAAGQRWILTDGRVYDWWELASAWDAESGRWVRELMREEGIHVLPRDSAKLGRVLDSRDFWEVFGITPERARIEDME
ncbi:unnamed protein product [Mycena citricolor]|uniref:Uncharacterized protein n=1 Tax=Mycena citricolor TaxID=2018698 RepID=A0AAD2JVN0_9AGAR|nr:unnamed protein product [Mycena citricolor]